MSSLKVPLDYRGHIAFVFTLKNIFSSGASYTPDKDILVLVGADTSVSIGADTATIDLVKGANLVLVKEKTYNFNPSVSLGSA
ncbi:MAG: hypothetical protein L3I99_02015 [Sulfurimonas sp.]|nr:hypothetical protein [Sulfurimonas sp.]